MPIDFEQINGGFEFTENDTVSAEDLEKIVERILTDRNALVTIGSNYNSFSKKSKNALPTPKTVIDATLQRNTEYFLGIQENLSLNFPTNFADIFNEEATRYEDQPIVSDTIFIQFISGETPTDIEINKAELVNFVPLKNKVCEIEAVCGYKTKTPLGELSGELSGEPLDKTLGWFLTARQFDAVVE